MKLLLLALFLSVPPCLLGASPADRPAAPQFTFAWCPYTNGDCRYEIQTCDLVIPPPGWVTNTVINTIRLTPSSRAWTFTNQVYSIVAPLAYPAGNWRFLTFVATNAFTIPATNASAGFRVMLNDPVLGISDFYGLGHTCP